MNALKMKVGTRLEIELVNSLGESIGLTYISQLTDIIDENNISIAAPIHESRFMLIPVGTRVRVIFLYAHQGLLGFYGLINRRQRSGNVIHMFVSIESAFEKIQRRKYYRLDCTLEANFHICDESKGVVKENADKNLKKAIVRNISGNGACMVTEEDVLKGTNIELSVQLPNAGSIKAYCKILRNEIKENPRGRMYELGLYFEKLSPKDQDAIIKYIFEQQRILLKSNILERDD